MRVITKAVYTWSPRQKRYILLYEKSSITRTEVALCKGATAAQNQAQDAELAAQTTYMNDVNTQFAANQSILSSLKSTFDKVVAAGSNQQGYNAQEMNALNSSVIQNTGQQYANAKKSLAENQAAQGGGNSMLPSGVASQQEATLGSAAANQAQSGLTQNLQASYNQGYQNYNNALSGELSVAGQQNATGMANAATGMSNAANSEANAVQSADQEETNNIMGLATGAMSGAASVLSAGMGKKSN